MTEKKVLILFGTRFGSAEGIAEKMAEILREKGICVDTFNLKTTPDKNIPELDRYDGILIGTGIKIGQWTKEVRGFLTQNKDKLNVFAGPKGFFVSSGYAADPDKYEKFKFEYTQDALDKIGVKIDYLEAFGGLMDFTKSSRMSWLDKTVLKKVAKNDPKINLEGLNDLRDWNQIEKFTLGFLNKI